MSEPGRTVVVLDRVEPGDPRPDYCIHGRATCIGCDNWVWLGHATYQIVSSGEADPLCRQCANNLIPRGTKPTGHAADHLRSSGPHG